MPDFIYKFTRNKINSPQLQKKDLAPDCRQLRTKCKYVFTSETGVKALTGVNGIQSSICTCHETSYFTSYQRVQIFCRHVTPDGQSLMHVKPCLIAVGTSVQETIACPVMQSTEYRELCAHPKKGHLEEHSNILCILCCLRYSQGLQGMTQDFQISPWLEVSKISGFKNCMFKLLWSSLDLHKY